MQFATIPATAPIDLGALMRSSAQQAPLITILLIANTAFFALQASGPTNWHMAVSSQLAWGANFGPATQDHQWWRLVTAMFVHFGIWHLAVNMWALWDVGRLVERLYGSWRLLLLYLGAGAFGNLYSLVIHGNSAVSAGASGAVFGTYGALLVCLWQIRGLVDAGEFRWIFFAAAFFIVLMLGLGWFMPGIDNAAHAGGFVAGALWGLLLAPGRFNVVRKKVSALCAATGLATMAAAFAVALPAPSYRFTEELLAREAIQKFLTEEKSINQHWDAILASQRGIDPTFAQLAGQVDFHLTQGYAQSFEQLAAASPSTNIPSANALRNLQDYAAQRTRAAHALANTLRDQERTQNARMLLSQPPPGR